MRVRLRSARWLSILVLGLLLAACGTEHAVNPTSGGPPLVDVDTDPAWSPDSSSIAYTHFAQGPISGDSLVEVRLMDLRTHTARVLALGYRPCWSPDGSAIAFVGPGSDIWVYFLAAGFPRVLTDFHSCDSPAWSPDGNTIAFDVFAHWPEVAPDSSGLWFMDPDGQDTRLVHPHAMMATWSPASSAIAYVAPLRASHPYWVLVESDTGTGAPTVLERQNSNDASPAWSPDGAHIAWEATFDGDAARSGVWLMNADGSNPRLVASLGARPAWAPDGRRLVYAGLNAGLGTRTLWSFDLASGQSSPLTAP